jgi:hypothetical protein
LRAKIMLLSGGKQEEANCAYASRLLTDISSAFGHSFFLAEGKMEEKAFAACQDFRAVFAGSSENPAFQALLDELAMPLLIRSFCVPESLCARDEAPAVLYVGAVLSLDEETLLPACRAAFQFAQEQDCRLCSVFPTGANRQAWEAEIRAQAGLFPQVPAVLMTGPEAISAMITAPERMGLILCPPYAGSMLNAAGTALCASPAVMHDMALDAEMGVFAPYTLPGEETPQPFSAALALAKLLRFSLRLTREAACLEAAVNNVLAAHSRVLREGDETAPDPEKSLDMICEQIAVAGELMLRAGLG